MGPRPRASGAPAAGAASAASDRGAADTRLLASQRARFATAAAAQQQQLASTQDGVADVAQEVLDAENFVSTSQANAGYGTAMPSVGRRLLGEL